MKEHLAMRAQVYLAREGVKRMGSIPHFDAAPSVVEVVGKTEAARAAAT